MANYTITVPDVPPSLNKVLRMHHQIKRRLRDKWQLELVAATTYIDRKSMKHSLVKKRVTVTLHHSRFYDNDNAYGACKVIFDVLKRNGYIVDDDALWLDSSIQQAKCPHKLRHTVIEIGPAVAVQVMAGKGVTE